MVENIAENELKDFIRGNIDYVLKSYRTYKNACFYKTAMNILSAIMKNASLLIGTAVKSILWTIYYNGPGRILPNCCPRSANSMQNEKDGF